MAAGDESYLRTSPALLSLKEVNTDELFQSVLNYILESIEKERYGSEQEGENDRRQALLYI